MIIPLFLPKVFMDTASTAPEELGFLAVVAGKAFLLENNTASN